MDNSPEIEQIEWDLPISEMSKIGKDGSQENWLDFAKLSLGTEMRNKIWEEDHKDVVGLSKNHGFNDEPTFIEGGLMNGKLSAEEEMSRGKGPYFSQANQQMFDFTTRNNNMRNGFHAGGNPLNPHSPSFSPSFSPSHHAQVTSPAEETVHGSVNGKGDSRFALSGPGGELRQIQLLQSENQLLHRQVVELKSVLTELHALQNGSVGTEGNSGLPDPVYLALQLLKMERLLEDQRDECRSLESKVSEQNAEAEKTKKEREFEVAKLKKDVKVIQEKLDAKIKECEEKNSRKEDRHHGKNGLSKLADELKEDLKKMKDEKENLSREMENLKTEHSHKESRIKIDTHRLEQELKTVKEHLMQTKEDEIRKKEELERIFLAARDTVERERQDKYMLLVEQNKWKHKVEKLTEGLKSYQIKNDELTRIQNELEQEVDGFRKLKKLIQEHGLPNHDQLIMLQQQAESYKEDVLSERKDRERAQAQREKLRRDFETSQTRLASLQEQVYKYQEHIMKLNTERQRLLQQLEVATGGPQNQGNKLMRQLSSPSFMGSKMNFDRNLSKNQFNANNQPRMRPLNGAPPLDNMDRGRGFRNNFNQVPQRGFNDRRPPSGGPFDGWQRNIDQQRPPPGHGQYSMMNKGPRSPLLNPQAEPWRFNSQQNASQNQQMNNNQFGSGFGYNNGIWSQQGPRSPSGFGNMRSTPPNMWQFPTSEQQHHSGFSSPQMSRPPGIKPTESWSTAADEHPSPPVTSQDENFFATSSSVSSGSSPEEVNRDVYVCRKCDSKYMDGDSFRNHVEKCFNSQN